MAKNIYSPLPSDGSNEPLQNFASARPAVSVISGTALVSSVINLTDNTTTIEIGAASGTGGSAILIKWIKSTDTSASVTSSNYDNFVPPNYYRQFAVPIESGGVQSIVGANVLNGLYKRVALIAHGAPAASVYLAQYN